MKNKTPNRTIAPQVQLASLVASTVWIALDRAHYGRQVRLISVGRYNVRFSAHRYWCRAQRSQIWDQPIQQFIATHRPLRNAESPLR